MSGHPLRVLFVVQGEGRGHLTQAITLRERLNERGHEVCGVFVGGDPDATLPKFFAHRIGIEPLRFTSPGTVVGRSGRGVSVLRTVTGNVLALPAFTRSVRELRDGTALLRPDLVVNFYDSVAGLALGKSAQGRPPMVAVAHQYLIDHPEAPALPGSPIDGAILRLLNRLSAPAQTLRLALSFRNLPGGSEARRKVVPPLLRRAVVDAIPEKGDHLLAYILHAGFADQIRAWHERNRHVVIHCFWNRQGAAEREEAHANLVFHRLSDTLFLEKMRTCRGFVGTAGFESVAEALWLGKPVMVVPTGRHAEQAWNARETEAAGAGIASNDFDLDPFLEYLPGHQAPTERYRAWIRGGSERMLDLLEGAGRAARRARA